MSFTLAGVWVDPHGVSASVTITYTGGLGTPTVYLDPYGLVPASMPSTISALTAFYLPSAGTYLVNGQLITLEGSEVGTISLNTETIAGTDIAIGTTFPISDPPGGNNNIGIGIGALTGGDTSGIGGSVAIGGQALAGGGGGGTNVAIGYLSMQTGGGGGDNVGIGYKTLNNMTGISDGFVAIGLQAMGLGNINQAIPSVAIGIKSLQNLSTGSANVAIGPTTMGSLTTGLQCTAVGYQAMGTTTSNPTASTCIGYFSGRGATTASNVTLIGASTIGTAQYATALGYATSVTAAGGVAIGTDSGGGHASCTVANTIVLGTANHTVTINTTTAVGNSTAANLTALAKGTGGGPASNQAVSWIPMNAGASAGWIPFFQ